MTSKLGATIVLKSLLNLEIDLEAVPSGNDRGRLIETVVPVRDLVPEADQVRRF